MPLAVTGSLVAGDEVLRDWAFAGLAALATVYAATAWLWVWQGRRTSERVAGLIDDALVVSMLAFADPSASSAGRILVILVLVRWALCLARSALVWRGATLVAYVVAVEVIRRGGDHPAEAGLFVLALLFICFIVATRVEERLRRSAATEVRAVELQTELRDVERRERSRLSQLLHDDALQRLLAARQDLEEGVAGDAVAMQRAFDGLADASQALRGLSSSGVHESLQSAGTEAAVRRVVADCAGRARLAASVEVPHELDPSYGEALLPILRELTANVERHAHATRIDVAVTVADDQLVLTVADDGRGIEPGRIASAEREGHLGIHGLRARVDELRGALAIESGPSGTTVRVTMGVADVRAHLQTTHALRHEREWNAALIAAFPYPFVVTTHDLRVLDASDRFIALTGWSRAELLAAPAGTPPYALPEEMPGIRAAINAHLAPDGGYSRAGRLVHRTGRTIPVIGTAQNVRDPRGGRSLRLVVFREHSTPGPLVDSGDPSRTA